MSMISIKWLIIFIIALLYSYNGVVVGVKTRRSISSMQMEEEDDLELERQLKILNKTPIKTFQIGEGQIIDCVDIYKQPAFDHPLLKNHKIQLRPSHVNSSPQRSSSNKNHQSVIQKVDCPKGTVPIPRTSKEDLIRAKAFTKSYHSPVGGAANTSAYHEKVVAAPGRHIAVVSTQAPGLLYNGIAGTMTALNPVANTGQTSSSQLWIESAPSMKYNTLQAGWIVSPLLFNDTRTQLFGYWEADGISSGGCYNYLCSHFVQIDQQIYLGSHLNETSVYGGSYLTVIDFGIYKDAKTGNWWLTSTKDNLRQIGYWPKELVPSLNEGTANTFSWGGAATVTKNGLGPEMGNGHFPAGSDKWNESCFIAKMKVYNRLHLWEEPRFLGLKPYADKGQCYKVDYYGYTNDQFEYAFQFGGPGGICGA